MDPVARLQASINQIQPVVSAVKPDQFDSPTTCDEWNVRMLTNHLLGALAMFRDVADKGSADPALLGSDHIGRDLPGSFDRMARETVSAWSVDNRAEGVANMPWGEMPANLAVQMLADDVLVHGWDLAESTGQKVDWNQDLAAETLEFAQTMFASPDIRAGSFADPIAPPADADAMTRLIAFLGRRP